MGAQKVALKSLKIEYDVVQPTEKAYLGTILCASKVLWVLYFGEVGELADEFQNHTRQDCFQKIMVNFKKPNEERRLRQNFLKIC